MPKTKQHLQIWSGNDHNGSIPVSSKKDAEDLKKKLEAEQHPDIEYEYYYQTIEKL
jgi:hypothetical protein